jgi:hypothetical protein
MILPIFSKPIFVTNINFDFKEVLQEVKNVEFEKIITSDYPLQKLILEKFKEYVYDHLRYHDYKFTIKDSWLTKTSFNEKSEIHNHRNSNFSGVLYLQTKNSDAEITFLDLSKRGQIFEPKENNIYNSEIWKIPVQDNNLIFFPAEVHHKISINKKHAERISLAIDFVVCN